jgi:DNA-binding transcriptional LysR family regulator
MLTIDIAEVRALLVLLTVEREGGFAPAARSLGVTRAAVSRSIAQLERRLGTRLARRTTRRVVLTDAALALVNRCRGPVGSIQDAFDAAHEREGDLAGMVRVAGSTAFGRDVLVPVLLAFRANNPAVTLDLRMSDRLDDLVAQPIDVTVRIGPLPETSLLARTVGTLPLVLVASPSLLREHGSPSSLEAVARLPAVAFRVPGTAERYAWPFDVRGERRLITPAGCAVESDSIDTVAALVRAGAGVAVVPRHLVDRDVDAGRLVALLPHQIGAGPIVIVCYASRQLMPRRVRTLIDQLVRELPAHCERRRESSPKAASPPKSSSPLGTSASRTLRRSDRTPSCP